jgi:hypothetical protein
VGFRAMLASSLLGIRTLKRVLRSSRCAVAIGIEQ